MLLRDQSGLSDPRLSRAARDVCLTGFAGPRLAVSRWVGESLPESWVQWLARAVGIRGLRTLTKASGRRSRGGNGGVEWFNVI